MPPVCRFLAITILTATAGPGPAQAPEENTPGAGVDVLSYKVEIAPDFQSKSIIGSQRILFRALQNDLREVAFSNNALEIGSAELDGKPVSVSRRGNAFVFSLPRPLRRGRSATLRLSFRGQPKRGVNFADNAVFTSYWACDWMICSQDAPGDKATFELGLRLPAGMQSLAAGTLQSVRGDGNGGEVHLWRESRPYSAYLYGFAAGHFREARDRQGQTEFSYLSPAASPEEMKALLSTTGAMARFLNAKAGVPLPVRRYTQLLIPGSEAQEAATYSVIGLKQIEPILSDPKEDWVIVHELAHQWWGNLVTTKNWQHFWLNEGIVTFMTAAWKEHRFGRAAYVAELDLARKRLARFKETGGDRPLAFGGAYPSLAARRAVQYSKGALFLDHLRTLLGEQSFWAGLKLFTRVHAGGVVESRDFQRAFEKASGRDLHATFEEWVYP
jgi:aminopeptidase N